MKLQCLLGWIEPDQILDPNHIPNIDPMIQHTISILYETLKCCILFVILSISIIFEDLKRSWFLLSKFPRGFPDRFQESSANPSVVSQIFVQNL